MVLIILLRNANLSWGWAISQRYDSLLPQIYGAITNAIIFYGAAYFLIPLLNLGYKRKFWTLSTILVLAVSIIEAAIDAKVGAVYDNRYFAVVIQNFEDPSTTKLSLAYFVFEGIVYAFLINAFYFLIAFVYRIPLDKRQTFTKEQTLKQEKLKAELNYLRAQIHPHTFFNGMNSIYHLIDDRPETAKQAIISLSNSLRYHLYESGERFVPLEKEIKYLREYISLHQIRTGNDLLCSVRIEEPEEDFFIAPLLFTPFVENAFKYVSHFKNQKDNYVTIDLETNNDTLLFSCKNSYNLKSNPSGTRGGLGIENIKKRLSLLYNDAYVLEISSLNNSFKVRLSIPLKMKADG